MRDRSWQWMFFRVFSLLVMIFFLGMLYWSSLVQEERLHSIEGLTREVREELSSLKKEVAKGGRELSYATQVSHPKRAQETARPYIDPNLPNVLVDDPYFTEILPKMLGKNFVPNGTLRMSSIGNADDLHPFSQFAHVNEWMGYCLGSVGNQLFGKYELFAPDLAIKIEERPTERQDLTAFWVHLREGVLWQPLEQAHFSSGVDLAPHFLKKHPVTARDFEFYYQVINNPHVDVEAAVILRYMLRDIERIEVVDDLTFVVYYKHTPFTDKDNKTTFRLPYKAKLNVISLRPLACFIYQYLPNGEKICADDQEKNFYQKSSLWAQNFANHFARRIIASCGAWIFDGASDRQIRFKRNPDHFLANDALFSAVEVYFVESFDAMWRDFIAQKIDVCTLGPQNLIELDRFLESPFYKNEKAQGREVKHLEYLARVFSYVGWNELKPYFTSKKVRQALAQAIDYKRLIKQNLSGQAMEITGPFFPLTSAYDSSIAPWPYDPDRSMRILAEEGWYDSDGDGIIDKEIDGIRVPFQFSLTYYVKNSISRANVELISTYLKQIGIDCRLNGVDIADLSAQCDDKSFDALYMAWQLGTPPEDPEQIWHSKGAYEKGSSNSIGFANEEVDRLIEALNFEWDLKKRDSLYHQLHALLYDQAPYAFLFTPYTHLVYWNWLDGIFIPKDHQELIPGADVDQPSVIHAWRNR